MASGRRWGTESLGEPAEGRQSHPGSCYRELSRFPAITRAALGAAAGGQAFRLYTGELGLARPRRSRHGRALTSPSRRVQPARPAPPEAPALQPALQPAARWRRPCCQPGSAQRRDPQPVGLAAGLRDGAARPCPWLQPPCRPQASQPGLAVGAAPRRAHPLPAAGPRVAGGNAGARGSLGRWVLRAGRACAEPPLAQVWDGCGRSHGVDLTALGKHGRVYTEGRAPSQNTPRVRARVAQLVAPLAVPVPRWALAPCSRTRALCLPGLVPLGDAAALCGREEPAQTTKTQPMACAGGSQAGGGGGGGGGGWRASRERATCMVSVPVTVPRTP